MYDEDFTITPFDPTAGIWFKHGRLYTERDAQIAAFEKATGFKLPLDFLEMIGEYCEGGFDGHYRVYFKDNVEIQWHHLLLMKLADECDVSMQDELAKLMGAKPELAELAGRFQTVGYDSLKLISAKPQLFGKPGNMSLFPFGEASEFHPPDDTTQGYLAFDVGHDNSIVFVAKDGKRREIAGSFREMMLGSSFVFYG